MNNEQHLRKCVRVDEDGALVNLTYVTNLLVEESKTFIESIGGDASWINGNIERHNITINNMVRSVLLDSNKH